MLIHDLFKDSKSYSKEVPLCPVFGQCGGCDFQDISYQDELRLKDERLRQFLRESLVLDDQLFQPIVASPREYHYRHRLDIKLQMTKQGPLIGFTPKSGFGTLPIEQCPIAEQAVSDFIPQLKNEAIAKLTTKYRQANLVVRTGENGRVLWGGMGRRSLQLDEKDYFWTTIKGKRIYYSLDTFFQANLSILPTCMEIIESFDIWQDKNVFYDLYGGVGLFGIALSDVVKKVVLIENNVHSVKLARFNVKENDFKHFHIVESTVEAALASEEFMASAVNGVGMIDPPRAGLSAEARHSLITAKIFSYLFYLSCNPIALVEDLKVFMDNGFEVEKIVPFDFFPKAKHIETLVLLKAPKI